jgi:hypothetical protein
MDLFVLLGRLGDLLQIVDSIKETNYHAIEEPQFHPGLVTVVHVQESGNQLPRPWDHAQSEKADVPGDGGDLAPWLLPTRDGL